MVASEDTPGHRLKQLAAVELAELRRELERARHGKDAGVHRARKAVQRLRSLLRLARDAEPAWVIRTDLQLRTLRRRLGRLRDAAVRVESVEAWLKSGADAEARPALEQALQLLREQRAAVWAAVPASFWERLSADWARQALRFERWPLLNLTPDQIDAALQRTRRRVRAELKAALGATQRSVRHELRRHLRRYAAMRTAAARVLRRRDAQAVKLVDAARSLGAEGDLWLTSAALRQGVRGDALRTLRRQLELQRRALCTRHDGELVALRRSALGKLKPRRRRAAVAAPPSADAIS